MLAMVGALGPGPQVAWFVTHDVAGLVFSRRDASVSRAGR